MVTVSSSASHGGNRFFHLDALRGIAAVAVLVNHSCRIAAERVDQPWISELIWNLGVIHFDLGRFGVALFFMISGFVIPFSLSGPHALKRFTISRFFRLFPAYWLSMGAVVLVYAFLHGEHFPAGQIAANATMLTPFFRQGYISDVYWTLLIEMVFYLTCAALYAAGLLRNPYVAFVTGLGFLMIPLVGIAGRAAGIHLPIVYFGGHLCMLFAGYLVRLWTVEKDLRARTLSLVLIALGLAAIPILTSRPDQNFTVSTPHGTLLATIAAAATFLVVVHRPFKPWRGALWIGTASYSIYLFHVEIMRLVAHFLPAQWGAMAFIIPAFTGTLLFAGLVYRLVEKPAIALGRTVTGKVIPARLPLCDASPAPGVPLR